LKEQLDDYERVKAYLLREFKLTAEQYRDKFWTATKLPEETYTLFGRRVKNLFMYYMDSRKVASRDDLIDLFIVSDRIKQTLSDACLRHVPSAESDDWFHPERLTSVIDTNVNSRLNMSTPRDKSDFTKRPVPKNLWAITGPQDSGGVNKSSYTSGPTKSSPFPRENRPPRCSNCIRYGHTFKTCWFKEGIPMPQRALFDKSSKQTPMAVTPKSTSGQAKVNQVSVQSGLPTYLLHARLADEIPTKLRLPHPRVCEKANAVLREIELRDDKTAQLSATGGQVVGNDTVSISASRPGTLTYTHDLETCIAVSENAPQEGRVGVSQNQTAPNCWFGKYCTTIKCYFCCL